jgi:PilZ domain
MGREERRKHQRITLPAPLRGTVGPVRVFVIDVSLGGIRLAHQEPLPKAGSSCSVRFEGNAGAIVLPCVVVRTVVHREARHAGDRPVHHSGLQIVSEDRWSVQPLRDLIAYYIERAMDEQKANARGIPATAALSFQTGKAGEYMRFELVAGQWRRTPTKEERQPINGFTVTASESDEQVAMLCEAYETGTNDARKLIRTMAELSISKAEGIPTRRYDP